jgi:hypothetical protein
MQKKEINFHGNNQVLTGKENKKMMMMKVKWMSQRIKS